MHRQSIIGWCYLRIIAPTEALRRDIEAHGLTDLELALDNFRPGRHAIYLKDPHWLALPVQCRGKGHFGKPDDVVLELVKRQMATPS